MSVLKAICIAVSTYSVLPVPRFDWTEDNMRHSLSALPLAGLPLGAFLLLWDWLCVRFGIGPVLFAAGAAALPILITGGIHMDGFCDTVDAVASRQSRERKLEILKDPHVGAFAVMYACVYLLLCFGFYAGLYSGAALGLVCVGFVFSRALAVCSAVMIPNARKSGMLAAFKSHLERRTALAAAVSCALLCACGMILLHMPAGIICILLSVIWFFVYRRMVFRQFGGATGDTTGFFLQVTELFILLGAVLGLAAERMV
jgi:adenosylcobinamide-GDP ribazoletransferase